MNSLGGSRSMVLVLGLMISCLVPALVRAEVQRPTILGVEMASQIDTFSTVGVPAVPSMRPPPTWPLRVGSWLRRFGRGLVKGALDAIPSLVKEFQRNPLRTTALTLAMIGLGVASPPAALALGVGILAHGAHRTGGDPEKLGAMAGETLVWTGLGVGAGRAIARLRAQRATSPGLLAARVGPARAPPYASPARTGQSMISAIRPGARFDTLTGRPLQPGQQFNGQVVGGPVKPGTRFDTLTGTPLQPGQQFNGQIMGGPVRPGARFDTITGQPLRPGQLYNGQVYGVTPVRSGARFDTTTGQPLRPGQRFNGEYFEVAPSRGQTWHVPAGRDRLIVGGGRAGRSDGGNYFAGRRDWTLDIDPGVRPDQIGDATRMQFSSRQFREVYFENFPGNVLARDGHATLRHATRVLADDGRLVVHTGGRSDVRTMEAVLRQQGLRQVSVRPDGMNLDGSVGRWRIEASYR